MNPGPRSLAMIQQDFQQYVLGTDNGSAAIAADITQKHGLNAQDRLAIYYHAYRLRMHGALSEAYGKTHGYIGDEMFDELSAGYLQQYPSRDPNLRWYGAHFAEYLAQALPDYPVVAELAAFEWALGLSFDAADAPVLSAEQLGGVQPEQWAYIGFQLQSSVQFLSLRWNASAIWRALDQEQTPPEPICSEQAITWLVWRKQLQPHFRSLANFEAQALQCLQQGQSFSSVCETVAAAADQDITQQIAGWLQTWLSEAVFSDMRFNSENNQSK